jgi:hypothetical protein
MAVCLKVVKIDDRGNDISYDLARPHHAAEKFPLPIRTCWNKLSHWTAMTCDPQGLACFVDLLDEP